MTSPSKTIEGVWVELKPDEVELFKQFRQYQGVFQAMLNARLFDFKRGSIVLHYNDKGQIVKLQKMQVEVVESYPQVDL